MTRKPTLTSAEKLRTPFSGVLAYRVAALFATYCTGHRLTEWSVSPRIESRRPVDRSQDWSRVLIPVIRYTPRAVARLCLTTS